MNKIKYFKSLFICNGHIGKQSLKGITALEKLDKDNQILLFNNKNPQKIPNIPKSIIQKIIRVQTSQYCGYLVQHIEKIVLKLIQQNQYTNICMLADNYGKDVLPRIAAKHLRQPITDIISIIVNFNKQDNNVFKRPIYAGNAIQTIKINQPNPRFLSFRSSAFDQCQLTQQRPLIQTLQYTPETEKTKHIKFALSDINKPELGSARIIISGGRGLKSKQNFKMLQQLADIIGDAAIGATRAAVDAGFCPNQLQIGQSGKIVAPQLYISIGISGAIQHLAGMKDSKIIVAINKNEQQPIFKVCNYGLVGDLFKILPELIQKLKQQKQKNQ